MSYLAKNYNRKKISFARGKGSYLYTANFAINNSDSEIAPYLGVKKIADAKIKILEAIEEKLTEKVKKSKYGKIFLELVENRKEKDSTSNN